MGTKSKAVLIANLNKALSAARDMQLGQVVADLVAAANGVVAANVTAPGTGYSSAPAVAITGGGGSGATGVAILSGTTVAAVVITNPGVGYTSVPAIGFTGGGGSGAAATAVRLGGALSVLDIDKR